MLSQGRANHSGRRSCAGPIPGRADRGGCDPREECSAQLTAQPLESPPPVLHYRPPTYLGIASKPSADQGDFSRALSIPTYPRPPPLIPFANVATPLFTSRPPHTSLRFDCDRLLLI